MTVTAPPRLPPPPERETPDDLEALIEEARRRARRRRFRNAGVALGVGAIILAGFGAQFFGGAGSTTKATAHLPSPPMPTRLRPRPLPENGDIALVQDDPLRGRALVAKSPDGSKTRVLAGCPGRPPYGECNFGSFAWSPDGRYIAFLAGHIGGAITRTNLYLYVVGANGGRVRELARCGVCNSQERLAWSPDSRWLAFAADTGLYAVDIARGTLRPLGVSSRGAMAAWSPSGSRIAFTSDRHLYSVRPDGSGLARIATLHQPSSLVDLDWSPDGTRIVFDGSDSIYVVDADGSHLKELLGGGIGSGPGVPSWSPNGRRILYVNTPRTSGHSTGGVWSMRPDGSDRRLLYNEGCCVGLWSPPIWSPDGRWIAFAGATESDGVVVMDADGRHRRHLHDLLPSALAWQPLAR